nr:MAG TPA: Receptor Binding Protein [Caudoviricetes sp.]
MAEKSGFFDAKMTSGEPDRIYSADDINNIFAGLLSDGVFRYYKNALLVSPAAGLSVNVDTGKAIVNNHWYINTTIKPLELSTAHATMPRYSSVVIRYTRSDRSVALAVVDGDPANTPNVPELMQTDDIYEIRLADILVEAGAMSITDKVTDRRSYCSGIVDSPEVDYRRYEYVVSSAAGETTIEVPGSYKLTINSNLKVYCNGLLCNSSEYTLLPNESTGNYMVVFNSAKYKGAELVFVIID